MKNNNEIVIQNKLLEICKLFCIRGEYKSYVCNKNGHINDTYTVFFDESGDAKSYIIQRVNHNVFKNPDDIMENIALVTKHIQKKMKQDGDDDVIRKVLRLYKTADGKSLHIDENGDYWRVTSCIFNSKSFDIPTVDLLRGAGEGFGMFQRYLLDFDASKLHETIPKFHDTVNRYAQLDDAIARNPKGRAEKVADEIAFLREREKYASLFSDLHDKGIVPHRVTHNDTKCNNIMFDAVTNEPLAVIDLDTVMPGFAMNDFGDALRFAGNTAVEDEKDLSKVSFDVKMYEAFAEGFLSQLSSVLTKAEVENMNWGIFLMTLEVIVRFLTDYINGDVYFKVDYSEHNLDRARCQIALLKDFESKREVLDKMLAEYL